MSFKHGGSVGLFHLDEVGRDNRGGAELSSSTGLLLDSNLLVLCCNGALEPLEEFLLIRVLGQVWLDGEGELFRFTERRRKGRRRRGDSGGAREMGFSSSWV